MARTVQQIKQSMIDAKNAEADLNGLNSTSQTSLWNLWLFIVAVGQALLEQITDIATKEIDSKIAVSNASSTPWLKDQILKFQYSASNPQVIQLDNNFHPYYPVVDPALRIISRVSVKTDVLYTVNIKVATGEPPQALSTAQATALRSFLSSQRDANNSAVGIGFPGVNMNVISVAPDQVYLQATIFYTGQYTDVIQSTVIAAVNQYLADLASKTNFDTDLRVLSLTDYIQAVPGVTDILIQTLSVRDHTQTVSTGTYLINAYTQLLTSEDFFAGYAISETTTGHTLTDSLTFTIA